MAAARDQTHRIGGIASQDQIPKHRCSDERNWTFCSPIDRKREYIQAGIIAACVEFPTQRAGIGDIYLFHEQSLLAVHRSGGYGAEGPLDHSITEVQSLLLVREQDVKAGDIVGNV